VAPVPSDTIEENFMSAEQSILKKTYAAFNARDSDAVLSTLHPDVDWPNGWEGGRVHGHAAVLPPHVEPTAFHASESGRTIVDVHTIVTESF
jgi:SnoaL-like domain